MSQLPPEPPAGENAVLVPPPAGPLSVLQESFPYWSYQDVALLAGMALPALIVATLIVDLVVRALTNVAPGQTPQLLAAQFVGYALLLAALYALLRWRYGRPFWQSLGWVVPARDVLLTSSAWGPVLAVGVSALGLVLRTPEMDMPIKQFLRGREAIILVAIFGSTLGPLCEEVFFRGFLQPLVVRSLGMIPGIVVAALPFALLHGPQYGWSWRHVLLVTVAGAAFGWVRHRTGSTLAATVMHATYNLTFFIGFLFQEKDSLLRW
jgi:uncharacterized protein